jgi:hypothetical protein
MEVTTGERDSDEEDDDNDQQLSKVKQQRHQQQQQQQRDESKSTTPVAIAASPNLAGNNFELIFSRKRKRKDFFLLNHIEHVQDELKLCKQSFEKFC